MQLIISRSARADLKAIARYSEREWGAARSKSHLAAFAERFALLTRRPKLGAPHDDTSRGHRALPVGRHLVFYRIDRNRLLIIRVQHERMDVKLHL